MPVFYNLHILQTRKASSRSFHSYSYRMVFGVYITARIAMLSKGFNSFGPFVVSLGWCMKKGH